MTLLSNARALITVGVACVASVAMGVGLACGTIIDDTSPDTDLGDGAAQDDTGSADGATPRVCKRGDRWGTPTLIVAAAGVRDDLAALSDDELTIIFGHAESVQLPQYALWTSRRASRTAQFQDLAPMPLAGSPPGHVSHPSLSSDGKTLFFTSLPESQIHRATRATLLDSFTARGPVTFAGDQLDGGAGGDGGVSRALGFAVTAIEPKQLWFTKQVGGRTSIHFGTLSLDETSAVVGEAKPLPELNIGTTNNQTTVVSRDGLELFFATDRIGGGGSYNIWTAVRASPDATSFSTPTVVTELASPSFDVPSWLSPDGCRLYLLSDRMNASTFRLYVSERGGS